MGTVPDLDIVGVTSSILVPPTTQLPVYVIGGELSDKGGKLGRLARLC
jgi:hypothetical protein